MNGYSSSRLIGVILKAYLISKIEKRSFMRKKKNDVNFYFFPLCLYVKRGGGSSLTKGLLFVLKSKLSVSIPHVINRPIWQLCIK